MDLHQGEGTERNAEPEEIGRKPRRQRGARLGNAAEAATDTAGDTDAERQQLDPRAGHGSPLRTSGSSAATGWSWLACSTRI